MRLGARRDPALTLVLILITCGIYYLYFIYAVSKETQEFSGEQDVPPSVDLLLSLVSCGLYNIYWDYKIGKRIALMCVQVGLPVTDNALLYLVLDLLGFGGFASLGLINPILQQDSLNRIWQAALTPPPPPEPSGPRQPRPPMP